ncbi:MAG: hypothetical protein HeimC3_14800 [Candidatus Heimdallarchaeota archaeon LC_3]|nr:MAG: hypothetical protein HeimC3_14800 [Candidatus Heimdallarchaeota archaeon LC_3]
MGKKSINLSSFSNFSQNEFVLLAFILAMFIVASILTLMTILISA